MHYFALTFKRASGYIAVFPDFPGCSATARTFQELMKKAQNVITSYAQEMVARHQGLPDPSSLQEVMHLPRAADALAFAVKVEMPEAVNVTLTFSNVLAEKMDAMAGRLGLCRMQLLADAIEMLAESTAPAMQEQTVQLPEVQIGSTLQTATAAVIYPTR